MAKLRLDLLDTLTVVELDLGSRLLKEDLVHAITAPTAGRWKGLAILAYLKAKHTDPTAKLAYFTAMSSSELIDEIARLAGASTLVDELEEAEAELARLEAQALELEEAPDAALEAAQVAQAEAWAPTANAEGTNRCLSANESSDGAAANPTQPSSGSSSPEPGARVPARSPG